ncbi:MAG: polysaccharide deacetylase family protein [Actinomycetota bacterium]|nr:polysaccharide deacetylase family protein [Actinomycetota bacterium]
MSILCYHSLDPAWSSPMAVAPATFGAHAAWLARRRTVVPAEHAAAAMSPRGRLPRGMAALTFDDGYSDLYDHALPLLARHALPATVFLVSATLTDGQAVDWVDDPPSRELKTLTDGQVLEMQEAGVAFGSHSRAHLDLTKLSYEECVADLKASREALEDLLRRRVALLAYPRGRHDAEVRRAAAAAGFETAFSLPETSEVVSRLSVPRAGVYPHNGTALLRLKTARSYVPARMRLGRYRAAISPRSSVH